MTIADPAAVTPTTFSMTSGEKWTVSLDARLDLAAGEYVTDVSVTMVNVDDSTDTNIPLTYAPVIAANPETGVLSQVWQTFWPAEDPLPVGTYLYRVTYTASPSINQPNMDLIVQVTP